MRQQSSSLEDESRYSGIAVSVVLRYWWMLPPNIRVWYGIEDMVNDVITRILQALPLYDDQKAQFSTFIYTASRNRCFELLAFYGAQRRRGEVLPIEEATGPRTRTSLLPDLEAVAGVEWILREASRDLRRVLARVLGEQIVSLTPQSPCWPGLVEEMARLSRRYRVTYDDFRRVIRPSTG